MQVTTMGQRQTFFKRVVYEKFKSYKHNRLANSELEKSNLFKTVESVYRQLGGQLNTVPLNYGSWDISTQNFIIELDEERHFNRYRLSTLSSNFYRNHSLFSVSNYKKYCMDKEGECLKCAKWGQNWKNNSTERMFLESSREGDLKGNGSSRWRQRAYYDFLKDVTSNVHHTPLIRVSIYDNFNSKTIDEILMNQDKITLTKFIDGLEMHFC